MTKPLTLIGAAASILLAGWAVFETCEVAFAGHAAPPKPVVRRRSGTGHSTYDYTDQSRYPVPPVVRKDLVYEDKIEQDTNYEKPKLDFKQKLDVYSWIKYFTGVRSPEREQEAWKAVKHLVELGDAAVLGVCKAADGNDPHVAIWCLHVMEQRWDARFQPILLNILDHRDHMPPELGTAVVELLAKQADVTAASWLIRMLQDEQNPAYMKDICKLLFKLQTPNVWQQTLTIAGVPPEGNEIDAASLLDLRDQRCGPALTLYFAKSLKDPKALETMDIRIATAPAKNGADAVARQLAAMVYASIARPEGRAAAEAMSLDRDENVAFFGRVSMARMREFSSLGKLIDDLGSAKWNIRHDAIEALKGLTGQDLGYDFANDRQERIKSIANWKNYEQLKNAQPENECGVSDGWVKVPLKFVTDQSILVMDFTRTMQEFDSSSRHYLISPGLTEGRYGNVRLSSGYGTLPLPLANGLIMDFRLNVKDRDRCEYAFVELGKGAGQFQDIAQLGLGSKPYKLILHYPDEKPQEIAYGFGRLDQSSRTVPFLRAGWMEGSYNDLLLRIMDDDNNGDFNDYGSDAIFVGPKQSYGTLLSSVIQAGNAFLELRVARSGMCCWLRPYKGALGGLRLHLPDKADFKASNLQIQAGSMCFDATDAYNGVKMVPIGQYNVAHAMVSGPTQSRAVVAQGESGGFSVEANAVREYTAFDKLKLNATASVDLECDDCSQRDRYKVPPGGRILKLDIPYVEDGGLQSYIAVSPLPNYFLVECTNPQGQKVFSERWMCVGSTQTSASGYKPFYKVFPREKMIPGSYKLTLSCNINPWGTLNGETTFTLTEK